MWTNWRFTVDDFLATLCCLSWVYFHLSLLPSCFPQVLCFKCCLYGSTIWHRREAHALTYSMFQGWQEEYYLKVNALRSPSSLDFHKTRTQNLLHLTFFSMRRWSLLFAPNRLGLIEVTAPNKGEHLLRGVASFSSTLTPSFHIPSSSKLQNSYSPDTLKASPPIDATDKSFLTTYTEIKSSPRSLVQPFLASLNVLFFIIHRILCVHCWLLLQQ